MAIQVETGSKAKAPKKVVKPDDRPVEIGRVSVQDIISDDRKALVDRLDKENPDFIHSYEDSRLTPDEIHRKGKELVEEDGEVLRHDVDPVVREPRDRVIGDRVKRETLSYQQVKDVTETERDPVVFRNPKKPGQK